MPRPHRFDYTPEKMLSFLPHEILVVGTNPEGRHGAGAALFARRNCGAIYGQAEGRMGQSYGIITKELRSNYPAITLDQVRDGVRRFFIYARQHPELTFYVTKLGCSLAYFSVEQMAHLFQTEMGADVDNVVLPFEFAKPHDSEYGKQ